MNGDSQHTETNVTTVEEYLRGCVGFDVSDNALATILIDRDVEPGTDVRMLDKRTKDLCKADLYMWCASTPSVTGSVEDADGEWKHKEGGKQSSAYDKRNLRQMANDIYARYGENTIQSGMKLSCRGMRLWRKR